jgi:hypothetical protein
MGLAKCLLCNRKLCEAIKWICTERRHCAIDKVSLEYDLLLPTNSESNGWDGRAKYLTRHRPRQPKAAATVGADSFGN